MTRLSKKKVSWKHSVTFDLPKVYQWIGYKCHFFNNFQHWDLSAKKISIDLISCHILDTFVTLESLQPKLAGGQKKLQEEESEWRGKWSFTK